MMKKRFCKNCLKETVFIDGACPECYDTADNCCTCGTLMSREIDRRGEEYKICPNDCEFEIIEQDRPYEHPDDGPTEQDPDTYYDYAQYNSPYAPVTKVYRSHCWKCRKKIDSKECQPDKVKEFAFICSDPSCDVSLREHPDARIYIARYRGVPVEDITDEVLKELLSRPKR